MESPVFTSARPPARTTAGSLALRSYPAAPAEPRTGARAPGPSSFTRSLPSPAISPAPPPPTPLFPTEGGKSPSGRCPFKGPPGAGSPRVAGDSPAARPPGSAWGGAARAPPTPRPSGGCGLSSPACPPPPPPPEPQPPAPLATSVSPAEASRRGPRGARPRALLLAPAAAAPPGCAGFARARKGGRGGAGRRATKRRAGAGRHGGGRVEKNKCPA